MKVAYITNLRTPYRTLQLNEFSKIENMELTVYYTDKPNENRKWDLNKAFGFKEFDLKGYKIFKKYGYINKGLLNIVKSNDLIITGAYEQPSYILLSIMCKIIKKPYVLSFDGISCDRINIEERKFKKLIKNIVISNASAIFGNGEVSKQYFHKVFNYPLEKIYNQYLTSDMDRINSLYEHKDSYRKEYRESLGILENDKVIIYSGRLIYIKNIDSVIKAINKVDKKNLVLLITGGGELAQELTVLAEKLKVRVIITGFIQNQDELFKHYFAGDAFILPSICEPWGLVVNEAMCAGLPILVSNKCGCSKDLVVETHNGYLINPDDIQDIATKVYKLMYEDNLSVMGNKSKDIIKEWTFENSKKSLIKIIEYIDSLSIYF